MANAMLTLLDRERLAAHYRSGFWRNETIYSLAGAHAARAAHAAAVQDGRRRLLYRDLVAAADALAADLAGHGVRPGERVAVWLPSGVETAIALLACSRQGFICMPSFHRDHTVAEVLALIERTRAAALIAAPGWGADADRADLFAAARRLPFLRRLHAVGEAGFGGLAAAPVAAPSQDPDRVTYLAFTSGTTAAPKGVMHSDNTLLANARAVAADWRLDAATVVYSLSPLSHNLGLGALVTALLVGAELVVHDLPRGASLLDRLRQTGASYLVGVPAHAVDLLAELRARGGGAPRIRGFRISGAAVSGAVVEGLMRYGIVPQTGYGMTEGCSHHYTLPDDPPRRIVETSGRCCPGFEIRIFREDDPDAEAATGETGQIGSRGASLMLGYFDDQLATEQAFNRDGWFMTGDLGHIDEAGYLRLSGRLKDIVNRGGRKIYPARIEALALRHPAVARAAAFPVADPRLGERLCLAVAFRDGAAPSADELLAYLAAGGLSRYDMPEYFLALDELPLTATGKPLKRALLDAVRDGRLRPCPVRFDASKAVGQ